MALFLNGIPVVVDGEPGADGPQGVQGEPGKPFQIAKTYPSIEAMNADYNNLDIEIGQFVIIDTGNVDDVDNAKLYLKGSTGYTYLTDLSGAGGMQGPQGVQGIQGVQGEAAGFGNITATVDNNVGIPSVVVSTDGPDTAKNMTFIFRNLKGQDGEAAQAAGFGNVTATVDDQTGGTPSVIVFTDGPNTAKNFSFSFSNLKGKDGETGTAAGFGEITATVDSSVGVPSVEVVTSGTNEEKNITFTFSNLKGAPGITGPAGEGIASGGSVGQLLMKHSETDYDTIWFTPDYITTEQMEAAIQSAILDSWSASY